MYTLRFLTFEIWYVLFLHYTEKKNIIYRHVFILFYFMHIIINNNGKNSKYRQDKKKAQPVYDEDVGGRAGQSSWFARPSMLYIYILQCCVSYIDISLWMLYIRYERNGIYINAFEKRFCTTEELVFYVVFLNDCRNYFEQWRYWAYRFL